MIYMRYPGGKFKAVTITYDDGVEQDIQLLGMMEKYGIKGTFNINSGLFAPEGTKFPEGKIHRRLTKNAARELYNNPMCEVACHGHTHPYFEKLNQDMLIWELVNDRKILEDMFEIPIQGFAYPYGTYNDNVVNAVKTAGFKYARGPHNNPTFSVPDDWYRFPITCSHESKELKELAEKFVSTEYSHSPLIFFLVGHAFEFERNNSWDRIEYFMKTVSNRDDIWYATTMEIYDYVTAYNRLEFTLDGTVVHNPSAMDVWIMLKKETVHLNYKSEPEIYKVGAGETVKLSV